jgi:hypothetical protein
VVSLLPEDEEKSSVPNAVLASMSVRFVVADPSGSVSNGNVLATLRGDFPGPLCLAAQPLAFTEGGAPSGASVENGQAPLVSVAATVSDSLLMSRETPTGSADQESSLLSYMPALLPEVAGLLQQPAFADLTDLEAGLCRFLDHLEDRVDQATLPIPDSSSLVPWSVAAVCSFAALELARRQLLRISMEAVRDDRRTAPSGGIVHRIPRTHP